MRTTRGRPGNAGHAGRMKVTIKGALYVDLATGRAVTRYVSVGEGSGRGVNVPTDCAVREGDA